MKKTLKALEKIGWDKIISGLLAVVITTALAVDVQVSGGILAKALWILAGTLFAVSLSLVLIMAGILVVKALIHVSVGLTLIIFLSQSYCSSLLRNDASDDALKALIVLGLFYVTFEFFRLIIGSLMNYKKKSNFSFSKRGAVVTTIFFLVFLIYFVFAIYLVMNPIIGDLCVYRPI